MPQPGGMHFEHSDIPLANHSAPPAEIVQLSRDEALHGESEEDTKILL